MGRRGWGLLLGCLCAYVPSFTEASLRLSNTLGSSMVLQRAPQAACLWGWGDPQTRINVSIDGVVDSQGVVDPDGKWSVCLTPHAAGGPYTVDVLSVSRANKPLELVRLAGVLFGEVWLCSGQSNMQLSVAQVFNASDEVSRAAKYPHMRVFAVALNTSTSPLDDLTAPMLPWSVASPQTIGGPDWRYFSAACWFFGTHLSDQLGGQVPVGLVSSSYGSTQIKAWSSPDSVAECHGPTAAAAAGLEDPSRVAAAGVVKSKRLRSNQLLRGNASPEPPDYYRPALVDGFTPQASWCFNAMVSPLLPMSLKGVVWSQGEQDIYDPDGYECLFPAMIRDWRKKFINANQLGDMAFGFTQLAGYNDEMMGVSDDGVQVGRMRVAQYAGLREAHVFMSVSYDLNDDLSPFGSVHYRNKQDVGLRLSTAAHYYVYSKSTSGGKNNDNAVVPFGPTARTVTSYLYGSDVLRVLIAYEGVGSGLLDSGDNLFELAASEASTAAIPARMLLIVSRETVMLEFDLRKGNRDSRVLRYALRNNPCPSAERAYVGVACGLYSSTGLPALPFQQRL